MLPHGVKTGLLALVAAGALAGAARAETAPGIQAVRSAAAAPSIDLGKTAAATRPMNVLNPRLALALPDGPTDSASDAGFARTAIERHSGSGDAAGFLGFLCDLQPGGGHSGASAAYGDDPHGRFVGAKFTFAFR